MDSNYSDAIMRKLEAFATGNSIQERDFEVLSNLGCLMVERYVSLAGDSIRRTVTAHGHDALGFWRRKNRTK